MISASERNERIFLTGEIPFWDCFTLREIEIEISDKMKAAKIAKLSTFMKSPLANCK